MPPVPSNDFKYQEIKFWTTLKHKFASTEEHPHQPNHWFFFFWNGIILLLRDSLRWLSWSSGWVNSDELTTPSSGLSGYTHCPLSTSTENPDLRCFNPCTPIPGRCQSHANYLGGFFREDDFVFPEEKSSTLLYEADSRPKPQTGWDLRRPQ